MHTQVQTRFGSPLANVRESNGLVFLQFGALTVMLDADEAETFGTTLLDAAGEARGHQLELVIPGLRDPLRVVRAAA